ncbi:hypothetical protein GCM10017083_25520 [Thalassobaculum fulvum]|uniref:Uncharacterized protein n=1 Tax=Thalassobaculum fulvum TaxID=1633335 RepID=A0A919CPP4_9PROT|nr:hexosyltransferase [Thalassobaculum fulvum]GHD51282.1 hypothetical protein GCM10017083_25520 [Thalassobaculum fulvum]
MTPARQDAFDVAVVTSATLPWRTGPAFLTLWYACGLAEMGLRTCLVVPWLPPAQQALIWEGERFAEPADQARWLAEEADRLGCPPLPEVRFYPGRYYPSLRSILPLQDVFGSVPPARVLVLGEPEHLCWNVRTRRRAQIMAEKVVGVVMTNYDAYARNSGWPAARAWASLLNRINRHAMRTRTDLLVPLSPAIDLSDLGHPVAAGARVTGVLPAYAAVPPVAEGCRGIYFLGRLVWDKGLASVIEIACRTGYPIDVYGYGQDSAAIEAEAVRRNAPIRFMGPTASPWEWLPDYRVYLNPAVSEVLTTAAADALVAGRHAVLPRCPANQPFLRYRNVHAYDTLDSAIAALKTAMMTKPALPQDIRHDFDWRNACRNLAALWEQAEGPGRPVSPVPAKPSHDDGGGYGRAPS